MAKTYTFTDLPKPSGCTATATSGGTLAASTTYYYRIIGTEGSANNYWYGKSKSSDEFSGTTDSTNKTLTISFLSPVGENKYYRIFRSTTSGGMLNNVALTCINFYPDDATYNSGGTVTFVDDGYVAATSNRFLEIDNDPHGILQIGGSTSSDKFSIVDLYEEDQAQGWGVIEKLDINTYKVNTYMTVTGTYNYWYDEHKTIIFADGFNAGSSTNNWQFGYISGTNLTQYGCRIVISSTWLTAISFGVLNAYRTSFNYVFPINDNGLGLTGGGFYSGTIQDCSIDKWRNFAPYGNSNCTINNCIFSKSDNLFSAYAANYNDVKSLGGSRTFQLSGGAVVVARGVYVEGTTALVLVVNATGSLTIIDSYVDGGNLMMGNYTGNNGFKVYDQFSFNLSVYEIDEILTGTTISGAIINIYDNTSSLVASGTTGVDGSIDELFISRVVGDATYPNFTYEYFSPFKIIISKNGYETYTEIFKKETSSAVVKDVGLKKIVSVRETLEGRFLIANNAELGSSAKLIQI